MLGQPVIEVPIASTTIRLVQAESGLVVYRIRFDTHHQPQQIRRWRFPHTEAVSAGTKLLDEALAAAESETRTRRALAEQATRRALAAVQRMRPGSSTLRTLEAESTAAMHAYLHQGQGLAHACAQAQADLAHAGFPTPERDLPEWIADLQRILTSAASDAPEQEVPL